MTTNGKALLRVLLVTVVFVVGCVILLAITGCEPVTDGPANKAAHPKSPSPSVEIKIVTGGSSPAGKPCREDQLGDIKTWHGHKYKCGKKKNGTLNIWIG